MSYVLAFLYLATGFVADVLHRRGLWPRRWVDLWR